MKINAVAIDDEMYVTKLLVHFLEKYCPMVNLLDVANTRAEGIKMIDELKPDLVFLDIELDEGTGFSLLDEIDHSRLKVIFVTSFNEYAIKAFRYNAIDYVLKPVQIEELVLAVNKVYKELEREEYTHRGQIESLSSTMEQKNPDLNFIAVPSKTKVDFIKLEDIVYLESEGRYTIFYLADGKSEVSTKNIGEYEKLLEPRLFFRIHNSYIINLKHVINIDRAGGNYCKMNNGKMLPISRRRLDKLERYIKLK